MEKEITKGIIVGAVITLSIMSCIFIFFDLVIFKVL